MFYRKVTLLLAVICSVFASRAEQPASIIDFGPAKKSIEVSVHILAGGSGVIQNYKSTFPEIRNLNSNMSIAPGIGARATFGLRDYLGITTEANFQSYGYNMDMAVIADDDSRSMSSVFVNNRMYYFNIPVCMTLRMNVARSVRWNIDLGAYYSYGFAGRQKQDIYHAEISQIGQLVAEKVEIKSDYFRSDATFQNAFKRGDIGIHFGSSLDFGPHLSVGFRLQTGLKNIAYTPFGIKNPAVRNIALQGMLGWRFN